MKRAACLLLVAIFILEIQSPPVLHAIDCEQAVSSFGPEQIPDHYFTTYQDDPAPEWKKIWDQARKLYTLKKYGQAQIQYELLLANKDNVDQARWEYVTILICRKQWRKAEAELALLISNEPDRPEYQLAKAEIALGNKDFSKAETIYAQLYQQHGADSGCTGDKVRILTGYVAALEGLGKDVTLIPLMEHLFRLRPENYALRKKIADIAMKIEQPERALVILSDLEKSNPEDIEVLQGLARVHTVLGHSQEAATYWQLVISLNVESREANEQLIEYYHRAGNWAMELKHTEMLLRIVPDDNKLLVKAASLNLALDRPDLALGYYNFLLSLQFDSMEIKQQKNRALHELAAKLFVLIENSGSNMLWQDLVQVTDDRVNVYRVLADMLRERGRRDELIQVLLVIHNEIPEDIVIGDELAALLKSRSRGNVIVSSGEGGSRASGVLPQ